MFLKTDFTQEDIDEAADMKTVIDEVFAVDYPSVNFEMLLLWWLSTEPAEA